MIRPLLAVWVVAVLAAAGAHAQTAPEPILRSKFEPARVIVGQPATLQIDVLAPNFMTAPPVMPDFQIRNAVTRALGRINLSEQISGNSYAGIRFEFAIFPQEAGTFEVAGQEVKVTYAAEPPKSREATLRTPAVRFEGFVPDAAASLDPFVSGAKLAVEQKVERSAENLKVGDSVTRTVTVTAEGTPAMLLPPAGAAEIAGLKAYPAQPVLQDRIDSRSGSLTATRTDRITYMLEKPGNYTLPGIEIAWWSVGGNSVERARADPVTLHVAPNPALPAGTASRQTADAHWQSLVDVAVARWPLILLAIAALCAVVWLTPRAVRSLVETYRRRRETYLASEAWSFAQLRTAARHGDAGVAYSELLRWLQRFASVVPGGTLAALKKAADDPELDRQIALMEQQLYGRSPEAGVWSSRPLMRRLSAARRRLGRRTGPHRATLIPADINPVGVAHRGPLQNRPVAR